MTADAVLIAGPTASGKSGLALALAGKIGGALVNADSMQVYREARILTARPGEADLLRASHDLYGHVSVQEVYSAARYQSDARAALAKARNRSHIPIFAGGTGLYFSALTEGLAQIPAVPEQVRNGVRERRMRLGAAAFFAEFAARDPETAATLRPGDTQRVLRAAEVLEASGRPILEWQRIAGDAPLGGMKLARFVLSPARSELYRRIDARFEAMIAAGALDEAAGLRGLDPAFPAARMLGLRELWGVLDGVVDLETARSEAKTATRRYAKRQLTWFRHRMADWTWIEAEDADEIFAQAISHL
ncbi:MAG TPA: tRNA (adenosine(37)-N6)-dimethylallyltransferase MiaA [Rhizomicrobium sp.]|jgi:tRNA dimethylallyltransferase|nr:tRNA (adenosine(37)-N6)-dimethylallyltransferase MiaA [Rhizomicrobium sp.]